MIINKLKEILKFQDIIKIDDLIINPNAKKIYNFTEYSLPIDFSRDINGGYLSLKDANDEQSKYGNKLKSIDRGIKPMEKKLILTLLFFTARKNFLNNF